ncbi:MAG: DUF885 domain-containing protein, partial [Massilia sp.]
MAAIQSVILAAALAGSTLTQLPAQAQAQAPAPSASTFEARTAAAALARLAERFYDEQAHFEPVTATIFGDNRFDDLLPMTLVPSVRARQFAMLHGVQEELMHIDRSKLSASDLVTFDLLGDEMNRRLRFEPFKEYLLPMNHMDSLPVVLANWGSGQGSQPIATLAQYQMYLKRISALPDWIDAAIANMRQGMREQVVLPKALVVALLPQVKALAAATTQQSDFYAPIRNLPTSFSAGEKARMKGAYLQAVEGRVLPALRRLASFLENDYLPAARDTAGWGGLPNGAQWYLAAVASHTTTSMT